jgi:hypothetical protein
MLCKKLCYDITIHLVTINFQSCIPYSVTPCITFYEFLKTLVTLVKLYGATTLKTAVHNNPSFFRESNHEAIHFRNSGILAYTDITRTEITLFF